MKRVLARVLGVVRADTDEPTPFVPLIVQFTARGGEVVAGRTIDIRLRVVVQQVLDAPLPDTTT